MSGMDLQTSLKPLDHWIFRKVPEEGSRAAGNQQKKRENGNDVPFTTVFTSVFQSLQTLETAAAREESSEVREDQDEETRRLRRLLDLSLGAAIGAGL